MKIEIEETGDHIELCQIQGFERVCFVTPVFVSHQKVSWRNGLDEEMEVKGGLLIPRQANDDGTCIFYRRI